MHQRSSRFYQKRRIGRQYVMPSSGRYDKQFNLLWPSYQLVGKGQSSSWKSWKIPQNCIEHSGTLSNGFFCFQNERALHQHNLTLLKTELATSCTGIQIYHNPCPSYHYTKRQEFLWKLRYYIKLWDCLCSFQKQPRIFTELLWWLSSTSFPLCFPVGARNWHRSSPCPPLPLLMLSLLFPRGNL